MPEITTAVPRTSVLELPGDPISGAQVPHVIAADGAKWMAVQFRQPDRSAAVYVLRHHYAEPDVWHRYGPLMNGQPDLYVDLRGRLVCTGWRETPGEKPRREYYLIPGFEAPA